MGGNKGALYPDDKDKCYNDKDKCWNIPKRGRVFYITNELRKGGRRMSPSPSPSKKFKQELMRFIGWLKKPLWLAETTHAWKNQAIGCKEKI